MTQPLLSLLGTGFDLLLVVLGFGLIIFFHELGHFVAARWAGIRVLAFAIGFGPALLSYRKGLGWRRGSSVAEVDKIAQERGVLKPGRAPLVPGISPTEYRLNVLPFGGYVKMLGQDDADPTARSDEPDGYQSTPPWRRMIVISAGVVANFIVAAVLFVCVFMLGLSTEPAVVGNVEPASPAATAVAINAKKLGVKEPGLQPGDRILSINNDKPDDFSEVVVATAMARQGRAMRFEIDRDGYTEPLLFDIKPKQDPVSKLLQIGVGPAVSATIFDAPTEAKRDEIRGELRKAGLAGVEPGMRLVRAGERTKVKSAYDIDLAAGASQGKPFDLVFRAPGAGEGSGDKFVTVIPVRELQSQQFWPAKDRISLGLHLLGLVAPMGVDDVQRDSNAEKGGLKAGDLFVQIGSVEWPSVPEGIAEIAANARGTVRVVVLRGAQGEKHEVDLGEVPVSHDGRLGFVASQPTDDTRVTAWPAHLLGGPDDAAPPPEPPGVELALMRGSRILRVNDTPVTSFRTLADALVEATRPAFESGAAAATVSLSVQLPVMQSGKPAVDTLEWTLPRQALETLHSLGWTSGVSMNVFKPEEIVLQAADPVQAVSMGLSRTHRVMMQTYLTFSRLFQGSVKVEHLKGPVGIAHLGTIVASQGLVKLLFFLALISVNLGVVNFLPIPIADGGHFLFLLYEQITGKPVSVVFQNIATLAGLILIAGMFLLVTYNDIANLFG
jgi:regulator of sigma E protease